MERGTSPKSSFYGKQRSSPYPKISRLRHHLTPPMNRSPILRLDQTQGTPPSFPFYEKDQTVKVRASNKQSSHKGFRLGNIIIPFLPQPQIKWVANLYRELGQPRAQSLVIERKKRRGEENLSYIPIHIPAREKVLRKT